MASSSTKVVYAALAGNVLVALSKFGAAAVSGSGAMLTEGIHSTVDSVNQVLLLIGNKRSARPADDTHNFGHGGEVYFWTFVVAVLVMLAGGAASFVEGVIKLREPEPIERFGLSIGVLAASVVFEGASFLFGAREARRMVRRHVIPGQTVTLLRFIQLSKDPNLYETLLEDGAALIGIAIAMAGVTASALGGWLWADGVASCAIGVLLVATAFAILSATRSLISGEAVAPPVLRDLKLAVAKSGSDAVEKIETLHLGPQSVLVALTLREGRLGQVDLRDMVGRVRAVDERVSHVVVRCPNPPST